MTYIIRNWNKHYENNRTRDLKIMQWIPVPNSHDSDGFTELITQPNGTGLFGAWNLIIQVASKCDPRGTLLRSTGKPHDFSSIARMTRGDVKLIKKAIEVTLEIGWIEEIDAKTAITQDSAGISHDDAEIPQETAQKGREGKGRNEGKRMEELESILSFESFWTLYGKKTGKSDCEKKFKKLGASERHFIKINLPLYTANTPQIEYRKNPLTYINGKHWQDEIIKNSDDEGGYNIC